LNRYDKRAVQRLLGALEDAKGWVRHDVLAARAEVDGLRLSAFIHLLRADGYDIPRVERCEYDGGSFSVHSYGRFNRQRRYGYYELKSRPDGNGGKNNE
jgi:hypothetical protein